VNQLFIGKNPASKILEHFWREKPKSEKIAGKNNIK
jgi:hypothetical protein